MKDVLVFGAGEYFERKKETIDKQYNIVGIIDNFKKGEIQIREGKKVPVYTPQEGIQKYPDASIVIAIKDFVTFSQQMLSLGVARDRIIFSQNMQPYGPEDSVYSENQELRLEDEGYCYYKNGKPTPFKTGLEARQIYYRETGMYRNSMPQASYADVDTILKYLPMQNLRTLEVCTQNDNYCHAYWIKKYCGIDEAYYIKAAIEHGVYVGDYTWEKDVNNPYGKVITLSSRRREVLRQLTDNEVYVIGPYIAYADYFKTRREMDDEKEYLGRNLLVFPVHTTATSCASYDTKEFIMKIKDMSKEFDSVRVCFYYTDILKNTHLTYKNAGLEIVSAGYMYDPLFLPRLKSMIYCSSMVMSNAMGSYFQQALYMNKSVYLYNQDVDFVTGNKDSNVQKQLPYMENNSSLDKFRKMFSTPQDYISNEQKDFLNYEWGFDCVKNKDELRRIIMEEVGIG